MFHESTLLFYSTNSSNIVSSSPTTTSDSCPSSRPLYSCISDIEIIICLDREKRTLPGPHLLFSFTQSNNHYLLDQELAGLLQLARTKSFLAFLVASHNWSSYVSTIVRRLALLRA
ncbi:hypothetical protein KFK09_019556 [Dendrobium nobile]|uniref:Uncharacterized protein n=1 Tax=Dendrobium nobile TaxID=94219 RepID=A0A8T3APT7_DENNO|nr:hypothetical protein KFK09_019556 [Dendrobium nobile]